MSIVSDLITLFTEVPESEIAKNIWNDDSWAHWVDALKTPKRFIVNDWIGDRWDEFLHEFSHAIESEELLVVHRCISVPSPAQFVEDLKVGKKRTLKKWKGEKVSISKRESLGIYWTWDFETAECHWAEGSGPGTKVVVTALVGIASINIPATVLSNFQPSTGESEKEIRLKEGAPILVTGVSLSETDPRWRFDSPIATKA